MQCTFFFNLIGQAMRMKKGSQNRLEKIEKSGYFAWRNIFEYERYQKGFLWPGTFEKTLYLLKISGFIGDGRDVELGGLYAFVPPEEYIHLPHAPSFGSLPLAFCDTGSHSAKFLCLSLTSKADVIIPPNSVSLELTPKPFKRWSRHRRFP